ncbi:hypothetical protein SESBI_48146 [Sesbania bispinosa]|nr:hypothetical protein SESBI_48146 [Sesbania bispinosa]
MVQPSPPLLMASAHGGAAQGRDAQRRHCGGGRTNERCTGREEEGHRVIAARWGGATVTCARGRG